MRPYLSLAILAYNERDSIRRAALRASRALESSGRSYELVLVDDGSTDGSAEIMDDLATELSNCRTIHHPKNLGVAAGIRTCYFATRGDWATWFPADLQADPAHLPEFLDQLDDCDVLVTFRDALRRREKIIRKAISFSDRTLVRLLFRIRLRDLHWVRFFRREFLDRMHLACGSASIDTEMVVQAKRMGARIAQAPLADYPRTSGVAKAASWSNVIGSAIDLIKLRWRMRSHELNHEAVGAPARAAA